MDQPVTWTEDMNLTFEQWCFQETDLIERKRQALRREKREIERERRKLEREKSEFILCEIMRYIHALFRSGNGRP